MTDVWRPLTGADAKDWVRLLQAAEALDRTEENVDAEDFGRTGERSTWRIACGATMSTLWQSLAVSGAGGPRGVPAVLEG